MEAGKAAIWCAAHPGCRGVLLRLALKGGLVKLRCTAPGLASNPAG